jgi:hypothetical protein
MRRLFRSPSKEAPIFVFFNFFNSVEIAAFGLKKDVTSSLFVDCKRLDSLLKIV